MNGMQFVSLSAIISIVLTHLATTASAIAKCNATHGIELGSVALKFVFLEPTDVTDGDLVPLLNGKWRDSLTNYFKDNTRHGFKDVQINAVHVEDSAPQDLSCMTVFPGAGGFEMLSVKHNPNTSNSRMLLAAVLSSFKNFQIPKNSTSSTDDDPVLRISAILAEGYSEMKGGSFKGDGTDTCITDLPTQQQVQELFSKRKIDFLLFTPQEATKTKWETVFNKENALLFPDKAGPKPSDNDFDHGPLDFIQDRTIKLACQRFPALVVEVPPEPTQVPTSTTTATTSSTSTTKTTSGAFSRQSWLIGSVGMLVAAAAV